MEGKIPLNLKLLTLNRELTDRECPFPDAVETREHMRELILLMALPVGWIPLDVNAFGVAVFFDYSNRNQ